MPVASLLFGPRDKDGIRLQSRASTSPLKPLVSRGLAAFCLSHFMFRQETSHASPNAESLEATTRPRRPSRLLFYPASDLINAFTASWNQNNKPQIHPRRSCLQKMSSQATDRPQSMHGWRCSDVLPLPPLPLMTRTDLQMLVPVSYTHLTLPTKRIV